MFASPVPPRTVALIGAVSLTVGWLLASTLTPPVARVQSLPARQAKSAPAAEQPAFTEQLHLRLQQVRVAPTPRRNPFVFGQRNHAASSSAPIARDTAPPPDDPAPSAVAPVPVGPIYTLAGIAIDGDVRTAILAHGDAVHLMKVDERIGGYDIVEITDNSVTLGDASGLRWVLRLR